MGEVTGTSEADLLMSGTRCSDCPSTKTSRQETDVWFTRGGDRKFQAPILSWNADSIVAKGISSMALSHIYKKELIKGVAEV